MRRTRFFMPTAFLALLLFAATPASATKVTCWWGVVDITSTSGIDPDGTFWEYVTFWFGWSCTDGYLDDERPYDPETVAGGTPTPPPPTPTPPPGCSVTSCLHDCDVHYLEHAGVEVIGDTIIEHYNADCGILCMELARMDWMACKGLCVSDCNLP